MFDFDCDNPILAEAAEMIVEIAADYAMEQVYDLFGNTDENDDESDSNAELHRDSADLLPTKQFPTWDELLSHCDILATKRANESA